MPHARPVPPRTDQVQVQVPVNKRKQWIRSSVFITLLLLLQVARSPSHSHSVLGSARPLPSDRLRSALVSCRHACRAPCPPSVKQVPTVRKSLHRLSIYSNLLVVSARPCHQIQVCQPLDQVQPRRRLNHPAHLALLQPECRLLKLLLHVATPKESPKQSY
jgi:hypothetical protein